MHEAPALGVPGGTFGRPTAAPARPPLRASLYYSGVALGLLVTLLLLDVFGGPSVLTAAIACGVVTAYCAVLLKQEPLFFVLAFLFIFGQYGAIVGGVFIEAGAFVVEQERFGFATGATVRLSVYLMAFLVPALLLFQLLVPHNLLTRLARRLRVPRTWRWGVYLLTAAVLVFVFVGLAVNGSPLLEHQDRFSYWRNNTVPLLQPVHNQLSTLVFLIGLCLVSAARVLERWTALGLVALTLAYFVFQGEKFTALVLIGYSFLLPIAVHAFARRENRPSLIKVGLAGLAVAGLLLGLILYQYATVFSSRSPLDNLERRVALQGHVWWGVDDAYARSALPVPPSVQQGRELDALLSFGAPTADVGMTLMMRTVAPNSLVDRYLLQGVRFTLGYPAIGLYLFGPGGLVLLQLLMAVLVVVVVRFLTVGVVANSLVQVALAYKLLFELNGVFVPGNLHELLSDKVLLYIGLGLLWEVLVRGTQAAKARRAPSLTA